MTLVWIVVALAFAIAEVATVSLFAGFVSLGAVGAAAVAFMGADIVTQAIVFAAVSVGGIGLVRRPLLAYLRRRSSPAMLSGAAAMIGQAAMVVDPILGPHELGHVRIAGENWPALTRDGSRVEAGATVRIVEIRRATLIVDPVPDLVNHTEE